MRPLILSCNTGAGHNTAAKAIREQFLENGIDCPMLDALSFASESLSRFVCNTYVGITIKAPKLFGAGYRMCEKMSTPKMRSASYFANAGYASALHRYLTNNRIDTVVMSHIFPAQCLTYIRKHYQLQAKTYLISTDYDCCPFVEETSTDTFFIPHTSITADFLRRGVGEERVLVSGIPTMAKFSKHIAKEEARKALGLPQEVPTILMMSGSMGFGDLESMVYLLRDRMPRNTQLVILGGNNEHLKATLRASFADDRRIHVMDFTTQADVFMDACDVMLTKPGGLTSTEAAVKNVPLIHTAPIPGCESDNQQFFNTFGMSLSGHTPEATADAAIRLLMSPQLQQEVRLAQQSNTNAHAAADIVSYILSRA